MTVTNGDTIRLEPEKAKLVDTVLGLIGRTVRGELRWTRRRADQAPSIMRHMATMPWSSDMGLAAPTIREYEATDAGGKWVLDTLPDGRAFGPRVILTRLGSGGEHIFSEVKVAALNGLAAVVEEGTEETQGA